MFRVLVVAYYYPPLGLSGVQRTLKFTKYFKDYNWTPTVITTGKVGYFAYDDTLLREAEEAGVEIIRTESINPNAVLKKKGAIKMPSTKLMKILGRISKTLFIPDNKLFWSKKAAKVARTLLSEKKYDAIYISVPPFSSIAPFISLKEVFNVPLFVDYRDAWISNQFSFYPTPYHRYKHKKLEDSVLRKVDRVIVVNRIIKEDMLQKYPFLDFKDIDIIPHGYDQADFDNTLPLPKEGKKMIITYAGIFYEDITPKYLLKSLKRLSELYPDIASNIELHFVGHFKRENKALVKKLKLERFIREIGYLSHKEIVKRIISSDILWLMLPNTERMKIVSPGKLFEYFGSRKPIIASLPEGIARLSAEIYKSTYLTSPNDIDEIMNVILKVHDDFINGKLPEYDEDYVSKLDRKAQVEQLTKIFQFYLKTGE